MRRLSLFAFYIIFATNSLQARYNSKLSNKFNSQSTYNRVYILIHGTWAIESSWSQVQGSFFESLNTALKIIGAKLVNFSWTGNLNHQSRMQAGINLAKLIESYPDNTKISLIGHSHGANVGIIASNILGQNTKNNNKIKTFYALGVPVDTKRYMPDMSVIKYFYSFFSFNDFVQPVLGLYGRMFPEHEKIANIRTLVKDKEPGHTQLHSIPVGLWLPLIHKYLACKKINNFDQFDFKMPMLINFYKSKPPVYSIDYNREKALLEDQKTNFELKNTYKEESKERKENV